MPKKKTVKEQLGQMPSPDELMAEVLDTKLSNLEVLVSNPEVSDTCGIMWMRGIPFVWFLMWTTREDTGADVHFNLTISHVRPRTEKVVASRSFTHKEREL